MFYFYFTTQLHKQFQVTNKTHHVNDLSSISENNLKKNLYNTRTEGKSNIYGKYRNFDSTMKKRVFVLCVKTQLWATEISSKILSFEVCFRHLRSNIRLKYSLILTYIKFQLGRRF